MKKIILLLALGLIAASSLLATVHFIPQWHIDPPPNGQAPYHAQNFFVYGAQINGVALGAGDEIAAFDGLTCVGAMTLTGPIVPPASVTFEVSIEGGGVPGSAVVGHEIIMKIWDSETNTEYSYPEMAVFFAEPPTWPENEEYDITFQSQGDTHIIMLQYVTPLASNTQIIIPDEDIYIVQNVSFTGTGVTLDRARILGVPGTGYDMTVYAFDELSTDTYYEAIGDDTTSPFLGGTVPVPNLTPYGWYIDPGEIDFYPSTTNPITITFNLNDILPEGYTMDPITAGIYRRDIHGTSYFEAVTSVYEATTNSITITITDETMLPGEFILTGIIEEPQLPVELSSFTAIMSNTNAAVNLMWVTQTESNMVGYRIYRGLNETLAEALDQNVLVEATNTSQPTTYMYADNNIASETEYHYWLEALEMDGASQFYGPIYIITPASTYNTPEVPLVTGLTSLYPNPFNPDLTINYTVDRTYPVEIFITNLRGQRIRTLVRETKDKGTYAYTWNGKDEQGRQCSSGVYYVKMVAGQKEFNRKAILMK